MAICDHLLLQCPLCATVIVSLLSQESFSISQVFRYVFPLLPQTNSFSWGQEFLAHAHLAVPLVPTMHLEFGGQLKWPQGFVGLSTTRKQKDTIIWLQRSKKWVSAKFSRKQAVSKLQNFYMSFETIEFLQKNWTKQKGKEIVTGKKVFTDSFLGRISRYQRNNFVVTRLTIKS